MDHICHKKNPKFKQTYYMCVYYNESHNILNCFMYILLLDLCTMSN